MDRINSAIINNYYFILIFLFAALSCVNSDEIIAQETVQYGERVVNYDSSENDQRLKASMDKWYLGQIKQDCKGITTVDPAIDLLNKALTGQTKIYIHGEPDPYKRKSVVENLRARPNPNGKGTIVHGWVDYNKQGYADFRRERSIWLILNNKIYPLNTRASSAFSKLHDSPPKKVLQEAGLVKSYERGKTIIDQLGMERESFKRFQAGSVGNPFPYCD